MHVLKKCNIFHKKFKSLAANRSSSPFLLQHFAKTVLRREKAGFLVGFVCFNGHAEEHAFCIFIRYFWDFLAILLPAASGFICKILT